MYHFRAQNGPFVLNIIFSVKNIITFIYRLDFFNMQNLKTLLRGSRVMTMCHSWAKNGPFAPNNFFKNLIIPFSSTYRPFCYKILPADPELRECTISGPKMAPFPQMRIFSKNLLVSLVSFIHAYLHARNQSQLLICK